MRTHNNDVYIRYINPAQVLPPVVSNYGNPPSSWGKSGTFEAVTQPEWIEEKYTLPEQNMWDMWYDIYETFRNGKEYPIKSSEVLLMMKTLSKVREGKVWDMTANRDKIEEKK